MMPLFETRRYDVYQTPTGFEVRNLQGRTLRTVATLDEATLIAKLYQDDDDYEHARDRWEELRGNEP